MSSALSRLTTLHISLIALGTALVLALILFFALIKPKSEEVQRVQAETKTIQEAGGTADQVSTHERDYKKALAEKADTIAKWQVNESKYMPNLDLASGDLLETYEQKLIRIPADWGRWVTSWYDAQKNLGVTRLVDFPVDAFPADPNYISTISYLRFPRDRSWPVTVSAKSFDDAMAHLKRFNNMEKHGVPVIDNVTISGQSPDLVMNYDLALYVIPGKEPPASDPAISPGGGGTGVGGGGFGGMPGMMGRGGMMGGPPGMMGRGAMMGGPPGMTPGGAGGMRGGGGKRGED